MSHFASRLELSALDIEVGRVERNIETQRPFAATTQSLFPGLLGNTRLVAESDGPILGTAFNFNSALEPSMADSIVIDPLIEAVAVQSDVMLENWRQDLAFMVNAMKTIHPNLFHDISEESFDQSVSELHALIPGFDDYQILAGLMRIAALPAIRGRESHMGLDFRSNPGSIFPWQPYFFEGELYLVDAHPDFQEYVGMKITHVGAFSIADILIAIDPLLGHDSEMNLVAVRPFATVFPYLMHAVGIVEDPDRVTFRLESHDGETLTRELVPLPFEVGGPWLAESYAMANFILPQDPSVLYLRNIEERFWDTYLDDSKTLYLQYNAVQDTTQSGETLSQFTTRLTSFIDQSAVDRVVVDMRLNGGGNNTIFEPLIRFVESAVDLLPNHVFVVIGRANLSAAGNLAAELQRRTNALLIGEPTGGSANQYGDAQVQQLPNSGYELYVPTIYHQFSDPDDPNLSVLPDIGVSLTFDDYMKRRDPVMAAILAK